MEDGPKHLPLKEAYRFGVDHGLERELREIRDMVIEWDLSYTSSLRRGFVVDLFTQKQLMAQFIEESWPNGSTPWGQRKCRFWLRLKQRYEDFLEGRGEPDVVSEEEEEEQAFAAEADLRDFLANNLACVEPGLKLFAQGERNGIEFPVEGGRIDVLAIDAKDRPVVFELKLTRGRSKTLGQLLYYMGWVDRHLGKGPCRGVIVASEISDDLVVAARRVPGITLYRYKMSVSLERVSQDAS